MGIVDSDDRTSADLILFALGFIGFLIFSGGIVTASASAAVIGAILLLLVLFCFGLSERSNR